MAGEGRHPLIAVMRAPKTWIAALARNDGLAQCRPTYRLLSKQQMHHELAEQSKLLNLCCTHNATIAMPTKFEFENSPVPC